LDRTESTQISGLLHAAAEGDESALQALIPLLHGELRVLARRHLFRQAGPTPTLCTTALVNEAFLRLADREGLSFRDRAHFLGYCSRVMRGIVVDQARSSSAQKRGGTQTLLALDENVPAGGIGPEQVLVIDQAISSLAQIDDRLAKITEMRVFGGLSLEECALVLDLSERSVSRIWRKARALLGAALDRPA
jgi:RNA polymerase sigma factor (TIGR02999 family)